MTKKELSKKVREYVIKNFGKRCKSCAVGCPTCEAWRSFYYLFESDNEQEWYNHRTIDEEIE